MCTHVALEATEDVEGEDDLPVFGLLVVAAEQGSYGPDEGREVMLGHGVARDAGGAGRWTCANPESHRGGRRGGYDQELTV